MTLPETNAATSQPDEIVAPLPWQDIQLALPPDAPPELQQYGAFVNTMLAHLGGIGRWAQYHIQHGTTPTETEAIASCELVSIMRDIVYDIYHRQPALAIQDFVLSMNLSTQHLPHPELNAPQQLIVSIMNEETFSATIHKIADILHDMNSPLEHMAFRATPDGYIKSFKMRLSMHNSFSQIVTTLERMREELLDEYPKEPMLIHRTLSTMEVILRDMLHAHPIHIHVPYGSLKENPLDISWSRPWIETLAANIAQNAQRAGATEVSVATVITKDKNGQQVVDFFFDNNGEDPPDEIVAHGFQQGKTKWDHAVGTGTGMAYHAQILRKHYSGDLSLQYRTDEQGNKIPGARVHLRLPLI